MRVEFNILDKDWVIKYPDVDYKYFKNLIEFKNDVDIFIILDNLLTELDCSQLFDNKQVLNTNHLVYSYNSSKYYYYMLHLDNQFAYNEYLDKYIQNHYNNLIFEDNFYKIDPLIISGAKTKTPKQKRTPKNSKYVRQVTTDLFTGKETYIYSKVVNGITETIQSDNPDLLEQLNAKPKKEKKVKSAGVPMTAMTFSFKKK